MGKKRNKTLMLILIIASAIVSFYFISLNEAKASGMVVHYYKNGEEVFPQDFLSVINIDTFLYDEISLEIIGENIGEYDITNMQIIDAGPQQFNDALPSLSKTLDAGETKTLWISDRINALELEALPQPINFWVNISGESSHIQGKVYDHMSKDFNIRPSKFFIDSLSNKELESLSFTDNENIIRYLEIPKNAVVRDAYMRLSGDYNNPSFQDLFNRVDNAIIGNDWMEHGYCAPWFCPDYARIEDGNIFLNDNYDSNGGVHRNINIGENGEISFDIRRTSGISDECNPSNNNYCAIRIMAKSGVDLSGSDILNFEITDYIFLSLNDWHNINIINIDYSDSTFDLYFDDAYITTLSLNDDTSIINSLAISSANNNHRYFYIDNVKINSSLQNHNYIQINGIQAWSHTGEFTSTTTTSDFSSAINNYLISCSEDSEGNCQVPITFHSDTTGVLEYSNINIRGDINY